MKKNTNMMGFPLTSAVHCGSLDWMRLWSLSERGQGTQLSQGAGGLCAPSEADVTVIDIWEVVELRSLLSLEEETSALEGRELEGGFKTW